MKTLSRSGRIVTAADDYLANIFIEDKTISVIGRTPDVEGMLLLTRRRT